MEIKIKEQKKSLSGKGKVAVIGSGWYGVHAALRFAEYGYLVTLFERKPEIFQGISGPYGIRVHNGMHYQRSYWSRFDCRNEKHTIDHYYPELSFSLKHAIYALGKKDATGNPPKVNLEEFEKVCKLESGGKGLKGSIDLAESPFNQDELYQAYDTDEKCMYTGKYLRDYFQRKINKEEKINLMCSTNVTNIEKIDGGAGDQTFQVTYSTDQTINNYASFAQVINATGFMSLTSRFPLGVEVVYQPLLALKYRVKKGAQYVSTSFIVMDGMFPCIMPYRDEQKDNGEYIVTHGLWTTAGSCPSKEEADLVSANIDDTFIEEKVRPMVEKEMLRFFPGFKHIFEYIDFLSAVMPKLKTNTEFRSGAVFRDPNGVVIVFPGKVSHVETIFQEVLQFIDKPNNIRVYSDKTAIVINGSLHRARDELKQEIVNEAQNTCYLQPYRDILPLIEAKLSPPPDEKPLTTNNETPASFDHVFICVGLLLIFCYYMFTDDIADTGFKSMLILPSLFAIRKILSSTNISLGKQLMGMASLFQSPYANPVSLRLDDSASLHSGNEIKG